MKTKKQKKEEKLNKSRKKLIKELKETFIYESIQEKPNKDFLNELIEILKNLYNEDIRK